MMEENTSSLPGELLGEILSLNIDVSLSGHYFTNQRKSLDQFPKTLNDINYFLTQYMSRVISHEVKSGLIQAADIAYEKYLKKSLISANELNSFAESLVNIACKSCCNEAETWWSVEVMAWLMRKALEYLSQSQILKIGDFIKNKLNSLVTNLNDQSLSDTDPLRYQNEGLLIIILKFLGLVCDKQMELPLDSCLQDLDKSLLILLKYPRIQLQVCWTLENVIKRCPSLALVYLSKLVTNTTIAFAELECLRSQSYSREALNTAISNLLGHVSCLAILIKTLPECNRGVPVEETEMAFNTTKNLVFSEYQGDIVEEEKMFSNDPGIQEIDNAKRHAAWILVDGLMYLGPSWVGSKLNFLFKLFKLPFGRKTCIVETMSHSWIIGEVTHKKVASSAMLTFLKQNKSLLQPQIFKLITVYLSNALQFLSPPKNSTQHRLFLEQNCNPGALTELKKNLYECLLYLPNTFISTKINQILNPIYSEVVNEKTNTIPIFFTYTGKYGYKSSAMTQLAESWISSEDVYIHIQKPCSYLHSIALVGHEGVYESWERKDDLDSSFCVMLNYALKIFSDIFTNSSLNVTNRQKLFQFISQHLITSLKQKDSNLKYNKVCTILLAVHGCLRKLSQSRGIITDISLTKCIKNMLSSVESISHPLVKCLFAEGMIYLCKVMGDPQYIPVFMKEIEHRIILSETTPNVKSGIVMQVGNMYKHFDIHLLEKNQDALGHIIQSISRDPSVGAWALHALYKAYSVHGNKVEHIFKATFPLSYHHYLDDHNAEFDFGITMMLLCEKHILLSNSPNDSFYLRALIVWEDTWKRSQISYDCACRLMQSKPLFCVKNVFSYAITQIPNKVALSFLMKFPMETFASSLTLFEWFRLIDKNSDLEIEKILISIVCFIIEKDLEAMKSLKLIILSSEKEQEEEHKGLSALNDRESATQQVEYFSIKSKKIAVNIYSQILSEHSSQFVKKIEENVNFAIHLTSFNECLSIKGLELAARIFKVRSI